jgi:hypothetical protein
VPHAFQDILGGEATPTLYYVIFAFSSFIDKWEELQKSNPNWADVIQPVLDKPEDYVSDLDQVPAYTIAMGNLSVLS